ncbi:MAG: hypothetical protein PHD67_10555, partial [Oscillospiraceae bacterium]|nr:hypothetical protein [Oscillospiraceae bacterium]
MERKIDFSIAPEYDGQRTINKALLGENQNMDRYTIEEIFACNAGLSADEMEALADFAGVGLFNLHTDSGQIELNRNITLLTGYEPGDLPHSKNTKQMLTFDDDREIVNRAMRSGLDG